MFGFAVSGHQLELFSDVAWEAISLNWRLIQTPPFVRDNISLHEFMHLRWLKAHSHLLRH